MPMSTLAEARLSVSNAVMRVIVQHLFFPLSLERCISTLLLLCRRACCRVLIVIDTVAGVAVVASCVALACCMRHLVGAVAGADVAA